MQLPFNLPFETKRLRCLKIKSIEFYIVLKVLKFVFLRFRSKVQTATPAVTKVTEAKGVDGLVGPSMCGHQSSSHERTLNVLNRIPLRSVNSKILRNPGLWSSFPNDLFEDQLTGSDADLWSLPDFRSFFCEQKQLPGENSHFQVFDLQHFSYLKQSSSYLCVYLSGCAQLLNGWLVIAQLIT